LKKVEVYDVTGLLISVRERRERGVRWVSSPQEDQDLLGLVEKALSLSYCHGRYVQTCLLPHRGAVDILNQQYPVIKESRNRHA